MSRGHIRRRGRESWELKFEVGANGTDLRQIRYTSFKGTKRAAEVELARLIAQHAAGESIDPSRMTVADFLARWDNDWASLNVSPKTLERYRQIVRLYIVPRIGGLKIQKLRPVHLTKLYADLFREGGQDGGPLSAGSVSYVHRVLHRALGHAVTWGLVGQNVATVVEPPPASTDAEISILNEDQIRALLAHLEGRTLKPIVSFLLGTGARRGEALALRWGDIDLDKAIVRIERSVEQTKVGLRIKAPKTKHGRRKVTIPPWLVTELRTHRARQQEQRLSLGLGRAAPDDSYVFARWDGALRAPHWLSQKFAQATKALKIDCSLHGLRHTHVSQLIAAGLDVLTISRRIGHASPTVTLGVYGHMFANTDARAAEIMEAAFAKITQD
jgi:integrase